MEERYCLPDSPCSSNAYWLLLQVLSLVPLWHYLLLAAFVLSSVLYNFLELHFFQDFFSGFAGSPVLLSYNTSSQIHDAVVSKCEVLRGRYIATPWLCSPHLQTLFLNYFGRPPLLTYTRELFRTADGGTIALDWLFSSHVSDDVASEDESIPIVVVIPGLTSDSSTQSDISYNAGLTEDVRTVVNYLHKERSKAPLFVVGTSIGANILVKYLGEEGVNIPVAGAVAVCSPWDLLIVDRYIRRGRIQKIYDKALAFGLQDYAKLHQSHFSRHANWERIEKSLCVRDFNAHVIRVLGKYESVDSYYRRCSSATYVQSVSVPLLCISALDDPICTTEAIPWDECKANENIVLATVKHGGHLAFFEGLTASHLWWVRAVNEFLDVLHSSNYMHAQEKKIPLDSSIDHEPCVNVTEDGMAAALNSAIKTMWNKHVWSGICIVTVMIGFHKKKL